MDRQGSLARLARRLRATQPPLWGHLVSAFAEIEGFAQFHKLIRTFVPEKEQHILATKSMYAQIGRFCEAFSGKWFPLPDDYCSEQWCDIGYTDMAYQIPVMLQGYDLDDFHNFEDLRPGVITMLTLLKPEDVWDAGWCVSLLAYCRERLEIPQELLVRAQEIGSDAVKRAVEGHKLYGGAWAELGWLTGATGNVWLDTRETNGEIVDWDLDLVKNLSRLWKESEAITDRAQNFRLWLEGDLVNRFRELVEFIESRMKQPEKPRVKTLAEVFGGEDGKERKDAGEASAPVGAA